MADRPLWIDIRDPQLLKASDLALLTREDGTIPGDSWVRAVLPRHLLLRRLRAELAWERAADAEGVRFHFNRRGERIEAEFITKDGIEVTVPCRRLGIAMPGLPNFGVRSGRPMFQRKAINHDGL